MKDLGAPLVHSSERSGDDSRFVTEVYSGRLATWDKGDSARSRQRMYWQKLKRSGVSQNLGGKNKTKRRMRPPDSSGCPVPDENSAQRGQITIILLEKSSLIITILTLRRARLYR
jgi:hypothetical protein